MRGDTITWEAFHAVATEALRGNRCWQQWQGYGNVLFLCFGELFIQRTKPDQRGGFYPAIYPVQVMADWAEWELWQGTSVIVSRRYSSDPEAKAIEGLTVVDVVLSQHGGSRIIFEQDYSIVITPWEGEKFAAKDAWSVRTEDGYYFKATCSGSTYKVHGSTPS